MQNERWYGELPWLGLHPDTADSEVPKLIHTESAGQVPGSQLKMVQYPPGWVMSHKRSPVAEQLVDTVQLSPIFGVQPSARAAAASHGAK
jgi:hypothetical protein